MSPTMEPRFADALRTALKEQVVARPRLRRRWLALGGGVAVALAVPATALAVRHLQPGVNETELSAPVVVTATGTQTVELGPRPDGATHAWIEVTCLSEGRMTFEDGAGAICSAGDITSYSMSLAPDVESIQLSAEPALTWRLQASYQEVVVTPFAVNADGDTYGTPNDAYGQPDLIAAQATNGEPGYVYAADLENAFGPLPISPAEAVEYTERNEGTTAVVPVYLSDGKTQVGEFVVGG